MVQNQEQPVGKITFSILIALSLSHCLNDLLQSVLSASYPLFKDDLGLSFAQIGLITLVYQLSASVFQPITGIFFDKHPVAWSLPIGIRSFGNLIHTGFICIVIIVIMIGADIEKTVAFQVYNLMYFEIKTDRSHSLYHFIVYHNF